jgi:lactoylglutathione lyase
MKFDCFVEHQDLNFDRNGLGSGMIKFLHTRIRVSNLEESIQWYGRHCGFNVLKRNDKSPAGNQVVHLELPGNAHHLELTYSPDYQLKVPEDLMHTCIGVDDLAAYCAKLEAAGVEVWPGNWRQKQAEGNFRMAFITDPDGYEVEIVPNT